MFLRTVFWALVAIMFASTLSGEAYASLKAPLGVVHDRVLFSQLGYETDPLLEGEDSTFTFEVPMTPRLQGVFLGLRFSLAAGISAASTIAVRADGKELARRTVGALRVDPTIAVPIPLPHDGRAISVQVAAHLRSAQDPCGDLAAKKLWVALRRTSTVDVTTARASNRPFIGEFLDPYGGQVQVVLPPHLDERAQEEATALAYELKRINRWRDRRVVISDGSAAGGYRIVVEAADTRWSTAGREMRLSPSALHPLLLQTEQLLALEDRVRAADARHQGVIAPQTVSGAGPLPVFATIPVDTLDSRPAKASLFLNLLHSAIPPRGVAFVDVYVDDVRASRQMLRRFAGRETFNISIDAALLSARTRLAIVPTYYPRRVANCKGTHAAMTFDIGAGSRLRWSGDASADPTVYTFLAAVRGRLAVLDSDDVSPAVAARILDILGSLNDTVTRVDVRSAREGPLPDDDALVVLGTPREGVRPASAASPQVSAGWYGKKPALFVSSTGPAGLQGVESAAFFVARGLAGKPEFSARDFAPADSLSSRLAEETYSDHLRHNAMPSLTAFACALTLMLFMSRRRERT